MEKIDFVLGVIVLDEVILGDEVYEMRFNKRENLNVLLKHSHKISQLLKSNLIDVWRVVIPLCGNVFPEIFSLLYLQCYVKLCVNIYLLAFAVTNTRDNRVVVSYQVDMFFDNMLRHFKASHVTYVLEIKLVSLLKFVIPIFIFIVSHLILKQYHHRELSTWVVSYFESRQGLLTWAYMSGDVYSCTSGQLGCPCNCIQKCMPLCIFPERELSPGYQKLRKIVLTRA